MITKINDYSTGPFKRLIGNENDTPPNDVGNGSEFFDMTNKKTKLFDAESQTWDEQPGAGPSVDVQALSVTENGVYTAEEGTAYSPVTVDVPQGGGGVPESDVNFYDYDGTIVASYSAADFANLTEMPANPDRTSEGLTAQGWNWSLADAKAYVADTGMLDVGQMYITTDGCTYIDFELMEGLTSPYLGINPNTAYSDPVTIDWGDGSSETVSGSLMYEKHDYASAGKYTIKITPPTNAHMRFGTSGYYGVLSAGVSNAYNRNYAYRSCVTGIRLGSNVEVADYAFQSHYELRYVTVPSSFSSFGQYAFSLTRNIKYITIPPSATLGDYCFDDSGFERVSFPKSLTSIGQRQFYNSKSLTRVAYPCNATLAIGFNQSNASLTEAIIPEGVETVGVNALNGCYSLGRVVFPSTCTSIQTNVSGLGLGMVKFKSTAPPTASSSGVFGGIPTDCKIYVPTGTKAAYEAATNYPNPSTYTYVEY